MMRGVSVDSKPPEIALFSPQTSLDSTGPAPIMPRYSGRSEEEQAGAWAKMVNQGALIATSIGPVSAP
jgi:hypothetical protein